LEKERQYIGQKKKHKRATIIHKTLHKKLKMEKHEPHLTPEGLAVPASTYPQLFLITFTFHN
jgi:hypothetical protein